MLLLMVLKFTAITLLIGGFLIEIDGTSQAGMLKLCPAGGQTFTAAWQLTCGMRRKRRHIEIEIDIDRYQQIAKRDTTNDDENNNNKEDENRPLKLTEMMAFCCRFGCSFVDLLPYCDPFGKWDS